MNGIKVIVAGLISMFAVINMAYGQTKEELAMFSVEMIPTYQGWELYNQGKYKEAYEKLDCEGRYICEFNGKGVPKKRTGPLNSCIRGEYAQFLEALWNYYCFAGGRQDVGGAKIILESLKYHGYSGFDEFKEKVERDYEPWRQQVLLYFKHIADSLLNTIEMVRVEGNGNIKSFYISKYPITRSVYRFFRFYFYYFGPELQDEKPTYTYDHWFDCSSFKENDWETDVAFSSFCENLKKYTGRNYRIPTLSEWEFAARGGNLSKNFQYCGSNDLKEAKTIPNELGIWYMQSDYGEECLMDGDRVIVGREKLGSWSFRKWVKNPNPRSRLVLSE